jgi:hypothetical protein
MFHQNRNLEPTGDRVRDGKGRTARGNHQSGPEMIYGTRLGQTKTAPVPRTVSLITTIAVFAIRNRRATARGHQSGRKLVRYRWVCPVFEAPGDQPQCRTDKAGSREANSDPDNHWFETRFGQ